MPIAERPIIQTLRPRDGHEWLAQNGDDARADQEELGPDER